MKKRIYALTGGLGILIFILQIFVFQSPDGILGYFICLFSVLLTIISSIRLYQLSPRFREIIKWILEAL